MLKEFEEKFSVEIDGELKEILSLCGNESIFFDDESRLLSIEEILNSKEEMLLEAKVIPIIDKYDNNFVAYDIFNKCFIDFDISTDFIGDKIDSIRCYIDKIKEYLKEN